MDVSIHHPWFRRGLGSNYSPRLVDQFFGEGMFDFDFFPSTISPYYRQSMFRSFWDSANSGISEVTAWLILRHSGLELQSRKYVGLLDDIKRRNQV